MAYNTIFKVRPKKENKREFCKRIVNLLDEIRFVSDGYVYNDGKRMINDMFKYSKFNNGYDSINDLLNEADNNYFNIFELSEMNSLIIDDEAILVNIDIIVNSLYEFKKNNDRYFYNEEKAVETINIIFSSISEYLLSAGFKLEYDRKKEQAFILDNEIAIDVSDIEDINLKSEILNFYSYKNANNIDEKKKILLILIGNLESKKSDISNVLGNRIAEMFSNYANNFNLRHNNIDVNYKKYYNKTIADLNNEELLKWYDFIFAFMINIYLNLNLLKDVNINNGYK